MVTVGLDPAGVADLAGNKSGTATALSFIFDGTATTVSLATTASSPTNASMIPFTATFSEAVTGFSASDVVVSNGTLASFSGSGASYSFVVVPAGDGPVGVSIAAGAASDSVGSGNARVGGNHHRQRPDGADGDDRGRLAAEAGGGVRRRRDLQRGRHRLRALGPGGDGRRSSACRVAVPRIPSA